MYTASDVVELNDHGGGCGENAPLDPECTDVSNANEMQKLTEEVVEHANNSETSAADPTRDSNIVDCSVAAVAALRLEAELKEKHVSIQMSDTMTWIVFVSIFTCFDSLPYVFKKAITGLPLSVPQDTSLPLKHDKHPPTQPS
jgi:hypothetical protein